MLVQAPVGLLAPIFRDPARDHGLARGRRRGDLAQLQVAVEGEGKRAWDRGRAHVQDVRRAALGESGSLLDPEAVLFIHNRYRQPLEGDLLLDQGVRADCDLRLAACDPRPRRLVLLRRQSAGQEQAFHAKPATDLLEGEEVLLGKGLGGRHQRALIAGLDRAQKRVERDHGLARADVALEQALHRTGAGKVAVDLGNGGELVRSQPEWKRLQVALDQGSGRAERGRLGGIALASDPGERQLEEQQLIEGEAPPPLLPLTRALGPVQSDDGVRTQRQLEPSAQRRRQRIGKLACERKHAFDQAAQALERDLLAGGIDGRVVGGRPRLAEIEVAHREGAALELTAGAQSCARHELLGQPELVEPDAGHLAAGIRDERLNQRQPAARPAHADLAHLAFDRRLLSDQELGDPALGGGGLVAKGPVLEQVAHAAQAHSRERYLERRPHAGERAQAPGELLGIDEEARAGPVTRLAGLGEGGR